MKKEQGITLIALIITIIILVILASVGASSGIATIKSSKYIEFTTELKLLQSEVNAIYQSNEKYEINENLKVTDSLANDLNAILENENIKTILNNRKITITANEFEYWTKEYISEKFDIDVNRNYFINIPNRLIISSKPFLYNKENYYIIDQIEDGYYNVDYNNTNSTNGKFEVRATQDGNKYKVEISNIQYEGYINNWQVKYKLQNSENWRTSNNLTFYLDTSGVYDVKLVHDEIELDTAELKIEKSSDPVIADKSGASDPYVSKIARKTYVTWEWNEEENQYKETLTATQPDYWYDYENGQWANIKTTNNGLEAYWVWIPRYEYIVPTSETATEIEVKFIPISKKQADEGYTIHPVFTNEGNGGFGDLHGIWVAKFEASSNTTTPDTNYGGGNDPDLKVQVKPGVQSWRNIESKNIFTVCRKMTSEGEVLAGSTVDSHMMKNMEWGAVAILSQSKYGVYNPQSSIGINGDETYQVWNNPSIACLTGSVGDTKNANSQSNIEEYNSKNGPKASTTGTVYGVYDMAGGSWEYVAGCLNGQENAKFGVTVGDTKYVDLYTNTEDSSNYDGAKIGDATKETQGWNENYSYFVHSINPVFLRGRLLWWHIYR